MQVTYQVVQIRRVGEAQNRYANAKRVIEHCKGLAGADPADYQIHLLIDGKIVNRDYVDLSDLGGFIDRKGCGVDTV